MLSRSQTAHNESRGKISSFGIVRRAGQMAKLKDVDPRAWFADMLARIADHPVRRLGELLPWHRREAHNRTAVAA